MIEDASAAAPRDETESPRGQVATFIVQGSLLLSEFVAVLWLMERALSGDWVQAACLGQFLLAMSAASAPLYCAARRRRQIYDPLLLLEQLLPDIRAGRAPLEDLQGVKGRLAPIARHLHEMSRELRAQKTLLAQMDKEVRQRIANSAEALERKMGSLRQQATRDALTGLLNRRALDEHLTRLVEATVGTDATVSVLMIDVDNFKPLNDTLGHAAGDELLRSIGQILRSTIRENDSAFRCGGDEFVVVLEGSDLLRARSIASRLGSTVDGLVKTLKVPAPPRLSIGAACLSELPTRSVEALLQEADKRLYVEKGDRKRGSKPAVPATAPVRKSA